MDTNDILKPGRDYHEVAPPTSADAFRVVVESRRSVRRFVDEPVPETVVRECLRLAHLAPSSSNLHQWEFHWVRDPALKRKVAIACMDQGAARTAPELIVCVARPDRWKRHAGRILAAMTALGPVGKATLTYYTKLVRIVYTVGPFSIWVPFKWLIIQSIGLFRPIPRGPLGRAGLREWAVKSSALACENLMLAFRAHGYDTCPMEGFDEARVKRLLKLERGSTIVMVVSAGRRAPGGIYGPQLRLPLEDFVFVHGEP